MSNPWSHDRSVSIFSFHPHIVPNPDRPPPILSPMLLPKNRLRKETSFSKFDEDQPRYRLEWQIFLARGIAPAEQPTTPNLWPPLHFPGITRAQTDLAFPSGNDMETPQSYDEISQSHFRIRFSSSGPTGNPLALNGQGVITYATPPVESYTPTREKPWQGLWVGDYHGHDVEFLLFVQYDADEASRRPEVGPKLAKGEVYGYLGADINLQREVTDEPRHRPKGLQTPEGCIGRLEAWKLTGDPNVPKGKHTWIAEDLSDDGLIRVAEEHEFQGARIVKSWSQVASNNYQNGEPVVSPSYG